MTEMGPSHRSQLNNINVNPPSRDAPFDEQEKQQTHDGSAILFTHLFSAPLIERKIAEGGSGCVVVEKVDTLSYEGELDTLHRTLDIAGKRVRFLSEAANTKSFARAVGCSPPSSSLARRGTQSSGSSSRNSSRNSAREGGSCRDGERRIVHFTGHGVPGQLTFEDDCGQLQYVDEEELLSMLHCERKKPSSIRRDSKLPSGRTTTAAAAAPGAGAYTEEVGRGGGGGYAPFVDLWGSPEPMSRLGGVGPSTAEEATAPRTGLQLVFLSSCYSQSVAKCFIEAGVRHVIAVKRDAKVLDDKALEFANSFYTSLLRGDTVRQAFLLGSACLEGSDQPGEGDKFLLLPPDGNHDIPVFDEVPAGPFVDMTPVKPPNRCDAVTEYFWGRAVDVQKVVKHMVRGVPCVTITGQKGIGKTQVLLKACAYTRERNVFGEIFFCRVDKAGRDHDACNWLEKGFQLPAGSLDAHNMDGAVEKITEHVKGQLRRLRRRSLHSSQRALLVLDGCTQFVVVGQERVHLKNLLSRLFKRLEEAGVWLTAAVTMQASGPTAPGRVGVPEERTVVVEPLDARSTAELFSMCCSRNLLKLEIDPNNEGVVGKDGKLDTFGAFAKSDIVRALRGHPAIVQDLCRCPRVHEEKGLLFYGKELLEVDIPALQAKYAYPDEQVARRISFSSSMPGGHWEETARDGLERLWSEVQVPSRGFYGPSGDGAGGIRGADGGNAGGVGWGRLCDAIGRCFDRRVPEARIRPLQRSDFDIFASDPALWRREDGPPAQTAERLGTDVSGVPISREKLEPFWVWFWQATATLRRTPAWSTGITGPALGFAGFMKKDVALALLSDAEPGTFLIRFSTSQAGALALHYSRTPKARTSRSRLGVVVSAIINVSEAGELSVDGYRREGRRTFHDLTDLVLSTEQLKFLPGKVGKEEVFVRPQRRESWSPDDRVRAGDIVRRQSMPPM